MEEHKGLDPAQHNRQIELFTKVLPRYKAYADALERVLKKACEHTIPTVMVHARAKTISSFAEKVVRKYELYPDGVNQMTDLCGARVITQTLDQLGAIRQFIEANFKVLECDDKSVSLGEARFGYRGMHYLIQLRPGHDYAPLGISAEERDSLAGLKAELQVRTWMQHAWADILHDRLYKAPLRFSLELQRAGSLLAAIMEDGDIEFNRLVDELDGMLANYTSYAAKEDVEKEINTRRLLLDKERSGEVKTVLALSLAQLIARAEADHEQVVGILTPYAGHSGLLGEEIRLELGCALCALHCGQSRSKEFQRGTNYLRGVSEACDNSMASAVQNQKKIDGLAARALIRLGRALELVPGADALDAYRRALEYEPHNPYYLADILGYEIHCVRSAELLASTHAAIKAAIKTGENHVKTRIELPYAFFTIGRLNLLLGRIFDALEYYALGIRYCLGGKYAAPPDVLEEEVAYIYRINPGGKEIPPEKQLIIKLLQFARFVQGGLTREDIQNPACADKPGLQPQVLIVAGGAGSFPKALIGKALEYLHLALNNFKGTVISGGTTSGIPGCVGEVAARLKADAKEKIKVIGYIPRNMPNDVEKDMRYARLVEAGESFSPEQIFRYWGDILASGIKPENVKLLGFGGGKICAVEYHMALALGASVNIVMETGGAAQTLLENKVWNAFAANLTPIPSDAQTMRAIVVTPETTYSPEALEKMGKAFHKNYLKISGNRIPDNMKPWKTLDATYKKASIEEARFAVEMLQTCGFRVEPEIKGKTPVAAFTAEELEKMAEMEHGRWNIERLRDGWRHSTVKDGKNKLTPYIVPWKDLTEEIRQFDREAVMLFPEILGIIGLKIYRSG